MPAFCARVIVFIPGIICCSLCYLLLTLRAFNQDTNLVAMLPDVYNCQTLVCIQDFQPLYFFLKVVVRRGPITNTKTLEIRKNTYYVPYSLMVEASKPSMINGRSS